MALALYTVLYLYLAKAVLYQQTSCSFMFCTKTPKQVLWRDLRSAVSSRCVNGLARSAARLLERAPPENFLAFEAPNHVFLSKFVHLTLTRTTHMLTKVTYIYQQLYRIIFSSAAESVHSSRGGGACTGQCTAWTTPGRCCLAASHATAAARRTRATTPSGAPPAAAGGGPRAAPSS